MSLQVRYCESCGKAWPAAPPDATTGRRDAGRCPSCGEMRHTRDAITVIRNLHRALARAEGKKNG